MALLSDYTAGTVSVAANGTAVTGVGTAWKTAGFKEGDWFIANGWVNVIASVDSETALTLAQPWRGGALTAATYRLRYMSDGSRVSAQARQLIDLLGGSGTLEALAALTGLPGTIPYFTGPGTMDLLTRQDLTNGVHYDVQVADLAGRAIYNGEAEGFAVLVSNTGDGRAAVYTRVGAAGNWSAPAYITGPSITLDVTEVDDVPYGTPPDVIMIPVAGGYELKFEIPSGMIIQPGTVTTLSPGSSAAVDFVPITGGYQINFSIPRGETGSISGLTPFWQTRVTTDTDAAAARAGLGVTTTGEAVFTAASQAAARTALGATSTGSSLFTATNTAAARDAIAGDATYVKHSGSQTLNSTARKQARMNIGVNFIPCKNKLLNPLFQVNQRGVSGTVSVNPTVYGHDRWKGGAAGSAYTFSTSSGVTTVTITAGMLRQVVEAAMIAGETGTYVLTWEGTATGRINGGTFGTSGNVTATLDGSADVLVDFQGGTVRKPMLALAEVTDFTCLPPALDMLACQRYYRHIMVCAALRMENVGLFRFSQSYSPPMRTSPTVSVYSHDPGSMVNVSDVVIGPRGVDSVLIQCSPAAAGQFYLDYYTFALSAEL